MLTAIHRYSIEKPFFMERLHQLDLIKGNTRLRPRFRQVVEAKIKGCDERWTRLELRLQGIFDAFVENP